MDPFTLALEGDIIRIGRTHIVIRCDHTTTVTTATLLVMLNDRIGFEGEFQRTSFACSFRRFVRIEGFRGSRHLICHAPHNHHQITHRTDMFTRKQSTSAAWTYLLNALDLGDVMHQHVLDTIAQRDRRRRATCRHDISSSVTHRMPSTNVNLDMNRRVILLLCMLRG